MWKESQEPGNLTRAAPNQDFDLDEVTQQRSYYPDSEADEESDDVSYNPLILMIFSEIQQLTG